MNSPAFAICWVLLVIFGIVIGHKMGTEYGVKVVSNRDYWLANIACFVLGMLAVAIVGIVGLPLLNGLALGLMAGAIVGLKMSFGESVGVWAKHDAFFNVNKKQRDVAHEGTGEERRRRRREGKESPQLISVEDKKTKGSHTSRK